MDELSGALNERVAIEAWVDLRDDAGASAGYWQARGAVFAAVVPDGGASLGSRVEGEARRSRRRWRVTLRAPVDVRLTSRLIWEGQYLAVLAVERDPRRPERVLLRCEERVA
nr:head-tail adaptor protein [Polymorphobacter sp.]